MLQALRCQAWLLRRAQELMADARRPWRERVEQFLRDCCYGTKSSIAVLSIEEEQEVYLLPDAGALSGVPAGPDGLFHPGAGGVRHPPGRWTRGFLAIWLSA